MTRAPRPARWLVAVDDTDSPLGGCTTALAGPLCDALGALDVPGLVRLAPASPWKTRGNAAVVVPVIPPRSGEPRDVLDAAVAIVEASAEDDERTSPGVAVFDAPPDEEWYWRGVRGVLPIGTTCDAARRLAAATWGARGGRGLAGALLAAAWRPRVPSYESIAYREAHRVGTPRVVDGARLAQLEHGPGLFDCFDAESGRPAMVPSTPCPVLFGLRGTDRATVERLAGTIGSEPVARRTLFATNQASDDHLLVPGTLVAGTAGAFEAVVTSAPQGARGGHVVVPCGVANEDVRLIAFEATGAFRRPVRALGPGDHVLACGAVAVRGGVAQIHLEKLCLLGRAHRPERGPCRACGRALTSAGAGRPLRCRACGARAPRPGPLVEPMGAWWEVAVRARRHLARPLKLGLAAALQASVAPAAR